MTQLTNQFSQVAEKGQLSHGINPTIIPCKAASALVPGQAVKLSDSASDEIVVTAITAASDEIFGIVPYNRGKATFAIGEAVAIVSQSGVVHLEASAAIARGAKVMPVVAGSKVVTATATNSVVGIALDKVSTDGDLVRVLLVLFGSKQS